MSYQSIFFGTVDINAIQAAITAEYTTLTGLTPNPSDPEYAILATIAYARLLRLQDADRAGQSCLPQFATGPNLDYIFTLVGGQRNLATSSVCTIQITLDPGRGPLVIPGGFLISSSDGQAVYSLNEDTAAPYNLSQAGNQLVNTILINATCTIQGSASNGYAIGTITTIQNPQPYILSATNTNVTSGGADVESDASIYARWIPTLKSLSKGGPNQGYQGLALSADPTIVSVTVIGPETVIVPSVNPGSVEIRVLTTTGVPTSAILALVSAACNPTNQRPMTDTVNIYGATPVNYSLNIGVIVLLGSAAAANLPAAQAAVLTAITVYTTAQGQTVGADVIAASLDAAGMGAMQGIFNIALNGFTDLLIDERSFANCTGVTVSIIGITATTTA